MSTPSFNNGSVVKCFGCENWFRVIATEVVSCSENQDSFIPQRWCFACLSEVDGNTEAIVRSMGSVPDFADWPESEEDEAGEDSN